MKKVEELKKEQLKFSQKISLNDEFKKIETIAGVDQAFVDKTIISCIVVCDYKTLKVIETKTASLTITMPYIPGLLAYREMPAALEAYDKLEKKPDVIMVDAHGILHPRRLGFASHLGLMLNKPTIGVAKKLMVGRVEKGKIYVGHEHRGFQLTTKEHARFLFISPGHKISLGTSLNIIKNCLRPPHKLPEPLHLAHKFVNKERVRMLEKG